MSVTAPKRTPHEFGFKAGDHHMVISAVTNQAQIFNYDGALFRVLDCLPMGQHADWRGKRGDTPPGLYKFGRVWNDFESLGPTPAYSPTLASYGYATIDMIDLEGHEDNNGRAGICAHAGGTSLGWPHAWAPRQRLVATHGCVRFHNEDMSQVLVPLCKAGEVFVSVHQDEQ